MAILIFGFLIAKFVNLLFPVGEPGTGEDYNLYVLKISQLRWANLGFPISFLPFYFLSYILIWYLKSRFKFLFWRISCCVIVAYFIYGFVGFGSQFWHIRYFGMANKNFYNWLASEHKDLHFSLASLLSSLLFTYMVFNYVLKAEKMTRDSSGT